MGVVKYSSVFAYSSIGCGEARKHIFVASFLLVLILLDLLLADGDLVDRRLVVRLVFVDVLKVGERFLDLAEAQVRLAAPVQSFDVLRVQAKRLIALKKDFLEN